MDKNFNCMIIDDEQDAIDYLSILINDNINILNIVATANNSKNAVENYFKMLPDLIFLDIEIDELDGFGILKQIYREKLKPYIIFVTAFNQYAVDAFKENAIGYLLKPVNELELKQAVKRFQDSKEADLQHDRILSLINSSKIVRFNTRTGFIQLNSNEITHCEAERNYTKIYNVSGKAEIVSLNLAEVEKKLSEFGFWRISRSFLANPDFVHEVDRKQKVCILRYDGAEVIIPASPKMIKRISP